MPTARIRLTWPSLVPLLRDVSLLYHEATFLSDRLARAKETAHSTAEQAARIAQAAGVERLVIGHYSARYIDIQPLLEEAQAVFPETVATTRDDPRTLIYISPSPIASGSSN